MTTALSSSSVNSATSTTGNNNSQNYNSETTAGKTESSTSMGATATNVEASKSLQAVVDIYPHDADVEALSKQYRQVKTLYYIRHAEGTHNVNMEYRDIVNFDARLTERGQAQCRELANRIIRAATADDSDSRDPTDKSTNDADSKVLSQLYQSVELVVTSPLTRCMQTALLSLEPILNKKNNDDGRPVIEALAHDGIRETVNFNCDRRRKISELENDLEFGTRIDFSHVADNHDAIWDSYESMLGSDTEYTSHRESAQVYLVAQRARHFFTEFLMSRPEQHICLCSHRAFSRVLWNYGIGYATNVQQSLDERVGDGRDNVPVVQYRGDEAFANAMRADYDNCELRAMIVGLR